VNYTRQFDDVKFYGEDEITDEMHDSEEFVFVHPTVDMLDSLPECDPWYKQ
jgi:hypothetical protein